jgi:hypothetical protein
MMKTRVPVDDARLLFRLDFALRGHVAYTRPSDDIEQLIALVERAGLDIGAPLLRFLDDKRNG